MPSVRENVDILGGDGYGEELAQEVFVISRDNFFLNFSLSLRTNLLNCFVWLVSLQHLPLSFEFLFFVYFTEVVSPSQDLIDS